MLPGSENKGKKIESTAIVHNSIQFSLSIHNTSYSVTDIFYIRIYFSFQFELLNWRRKNTINCISDSRKALVRKEISLKKRLRAE